MSIVIAARGASRTRLAVYTLAACVAGIGLFLVCIGLRRSLWFDEAWVANSATSTSLYEVFYYPHWLQTSPPLFLLVVRASAAAFGLTTLSLRMVPLVMGVVSAALMAVVARRLWSIAYGLLAWVTFVLSPATIVFSANLKQYSSELAAASAILLAALMYRQHPNSRRFCLLLAAVSIGLLASYPLVFALPGITLFVTLVPVPSRAAPSVSSKSASLLRGLILGVINASIFGVEYIFLIAPNTSPALYSFWAPRPGIAIAILSACGRLLKLLPLNGPLPSTIEPVPLTAGLITRALVIAVIALTGFVLAFLRFLKGRRKWIEIQVLCLSPCLVAVVAHAASWYPASPRTSLFLLPFLVTFLTSSVQLMATFLISRFRQPWLRPSVRVALFVLTIATIAVGINNVPVSQLKAPTEDVESAVSFLRSHVRRDDLLWVHASMSESFALYKRILGWSDPPAVYGHTGSPCCPRGVVSARSVGSEESIRRDIDDALPVGRSGKIWLLYTGHWAWVGQDEAVIAKRILRQKGCSESDAQSFYNVGLAVFDCLVSRGDIRR